MIGRAVVFLIATLVLAGTAFAQQPSCPLPTAPRIVSGSSYTVSTADNCWWIILTSTGAVTVSLPAPGLIFPPGFATTILPLNGAAVTLVALADDGGHAHVVNNSTSAVFGAGVGMLLKVLQDVSWYALPTGDAAPWSPEIHEVSGGGWTNPFAAPVHGLAWRDQTLAINGDWIQATSKDGSLKVNVTVGNATSGDNVGYNIKIGATTYQVRYLVKAGDTNQLVAVGICNAMVGNAPLMAAYLAYNVPTSGDNIGDGKGYKPIQDSGTCLSQTSGGVIQFDLPWSPTAATTITAVGATTTVTVTGNGGTSTLTLDGGPTLALVRTVPGYTPAVDDLGPQIYFQGPNTTPAALGTIGSINTQYDSASSIHMDLDVLTSGSIQRILRLQNGKAIINGTGDATTYTLSNGAGGTINNDGSSNLQFLAASGKTAVIGAQSGTTSFTVGGATTFFTGAGGNFLTFSGDGSNNSLMQFASGKQLSVQAFGGTVSLNLTGTTATIAGLGATPTGKRILCIDNSTGALSIGTAGAAC